jgi:hypothetical protein
VQARPDSLSIGKEPGFPFFLSIFARHCSQRRDRVARGECIYYLNGSFYFFTCNSDVWFVPEYM